MYIEKLKNEITTLKNDINESDAILYELENERDEIETSIIDEDYRNTCMKDTLKELEQKLLDMQTPQENLPYWVNRIIDKERPRVNGQFNYKGKWCITNGYLIIFFNHKLDFLQECEGLEPKTLDNIFNSNNMQKVDINNIEEYDDKLYLNDCILSPYYFNIAKNVLQLTNEDEYYISNFDNCKSLICENENGKAFILGMRF